jgi:hypothetical protein
VTSTSFSQKIFWKRQKSVSAMIKNYKARITHIKKRNKENKTYD